MSWSSLPDYPAPQDQKITAPAVVDKAEISLRSTYRYTDLLKLLAILVLLCWLGWLRSDIVRSRTPPPPLQPLDFLQIQHNYEKVRWLTDSPKEVEQLLGPPTQHAVRSPDLDQREAQAERFSRPMPKDRCWDQWIDPEDPGKWIAILYAGEKVYCKVKKGF